MMLRLLESGRVYKISELAEILECSERSIRLYKESLEQSGIYIESIPGRYGGYFYQDVSKQICFNLHKTDLNNLENLYLKLKNINDKDINLSSLESVIDKLRCILIFNVNIKAQPKEVEDIYNYLSELIVNDLNLHFIYKSKSMILKPHNIYVHSNNLYITGFNYSINQIRTYNINDIKIIK